MKNAILRAGNGLFSWRSEVRRTMTTEKAETERLQTVYANLQPKQKQLAEGLIAQAARLRVQLDKLNSDIRKNGLTELYTNSDKIDPYTRERPEANLFIKLDKNYQAIIRQLNEMLPPEEDNGDDEISQFRSGM